MIRLDRMKQSIKAQMTTVGLIVFGASLATVVFGGLLTDRLFSVPPIPQGIEWIFAGGALLLSGAALCGWCVALFRKARGTPVPFNPPDELLQTGIYGWMRNPMLTGVFWALFGVGILLHSLSVVLFWTPGYENHRPMPARSRSGVPTWPSAASPPSRSTSRGPSASREPWGR